MAFGLRARNGGGGAGRRVAPPRSLGPREEGGAAGWFARRRPGRRRGAAAVPGTREEGGHPMGLGRSARNGGGDAREEGGTAADHKPREENGLKAGLVADREVSIVKEILSLLLQAGRRFTKN